MSETEIRNVRNAVVMEAYLLIMLLAAVIMQLVGMLIMALAFATLAISTGLTAILVLLRSGLNFMSDVRNTIGSHLYTTKF